MPERKSISSSILLSEFESIKNNNPESIPKRIRDVIDKGDQALVIVLGGGGAKSPQHIGVIAALLEAGVPLDMAVGTSAGAVGAIASKVGSLSELLKTKYLAERMSWNQISQLTFLKNGGFVCFDRLSGYINSHQNDLKDPTKYTPCLIVTTQISRLRNSARIFWEESSDLIGKAVQASCSVPFFISYPIIKEYYPLVDGGFIRVNDLPFNIAKLIAPDSLKISVNLSRKPPNINYDGILISPSLYARNNRLATAVFDPDDVWLGYKSGNAAIPKIYEEMERRGIERHYREGFSPDTNLAYYFSQRILI